MGESISCGKSSELLPTAISYVQRACGEVPTMLSYRMIVCVTSGMICVSAFSWLISLDQLKNGLFGYESMYGHLHALLHESAQNLLFTLLSYFVTHIRLRYTSNHFILITDAIHTLPTVENA